MPAHNKPGSVYSTAAWQRLKLACFERDGWRCRRCGRLGTQKGGTVVLTCAHLLPERVRLALRRPLTINDVATLCRQCHGKVDGGRRYR